MTLRGPLLSLSFNWVAGTHALSNPAVHADIAQVVAKRNVTLLGVPSSLICFCYLSQAVAISITTKERALISRGPSFMLRAGGGPGQLDTDFRLLSTYYTLAATVFWRCQGLRCAEIKLTHVVEGSRASRSWRSVIENMLRVYSGMHTDE